MTRKTKLETCKSHRELKGSTWVRFCLIWSMKSPFAWHKGPSGAFKGFFRAFSMQTPVNCFVTLKVLINRGERTINTIFAYLLIQKCTNKRKILSNIWKGNKDRQQTITLHASIKSLPDWLATSYYYFLYFLYFNAYTHTQFYYFYLVSIKFNTIRYTLHYICRWFIENLRKEPWT